MKKFMEIIPLSSVDCERIFSVMNLIKDKRKSSLKTKNLIHRIVLYYHGEPVD